MATLTDKQVEKKEKIVKSMKKNSADFQKRYGKDAKSVMHATATKLAKNESVEWEANFPCAEDAYSFANKLDTYTITENTTQSISKNLDGTASFFFESSIDNETFLEWLAKENNAESLSLSYDNLLPGVPADPNTGELYQTFEGFNRSIKKKTPAYIEESVDNAYKKTRAYKALNTKDKQAVDYFMSEVEKQGMGKMDRVIDQTAKKYPIKADDLSDFLENIFFAEDVEYIRSLCEEEGKSEIQKKNETDSAKKNQDAKDKKEKEQQKKEQDGKDVTKAKKDADKERRSDSDGDKDGKDGNDQQGGPGQEKTFKNFSSNLKSQKAKGKDSVGDDSEDQEKEIKLEKPQKGSSIEKNPELEESLNSKNYVRSLYDTPNNKKSNNSAKDIFDRIYPKIKAGKSLKSVKMPDLMAAIKYGAENKLLSKKEANHIHDEMLDHRDFFKYH